jgi:alkaline phosphatase
LVREVLQTDYVVNAGRKVQRVYHFGSQETGGVFSNYTSHTNRLIPVYVFGRLADLNTVTGQNSRYRDVQKIKELYGVVRWKWARKTDPPGGNMGA